MIQNIKIFKMASKIIYKGKTYYWVNSCSTKQEADKFASEEKKKNYSVVIKKLPTPTKGVGAWKDKTIRYYVYERSVKK